MTFDLKFRITCLQHCKKNFFNKEIIHSMIGGGKNLIINYINNRWRLLYILLFIRDFNKIIKSNW